MYDIYKLWLWFINYSDASDGLIWEDITSAEEREKCGNNRRPVRRNSIARALYYLLLGWIFSFMLVFVVCPGIMLLENFINLTALEWDVTVKDVFVFILMAIAIPLVVSACIYIWNEIQNVIGNVD
jgi:hypothetical protein